MQWVCLDCMHVCVLTRNCVREQLCHCAYIMAWVMLMVLHAHLLHASLSQT